MNSNRSESIEIVIKYINDKIIQFDIDDNKGIISENLTNNAKKKNIICRLSAMLEEDYTESKLEAIKNIESKLFESRIDIEHIQSYNDEEVNERTKIREKWGLELNSLGNLMVLESSKNRSIHNKKYEEKLKQYKSSQYRIVKNQTQKYTNWDLDKCKDRRKTEEEKLINYLFSCDKNMANISKKKD